MDDAQPFDTLHARFKIERRGLVQSHPAGARRMMRRHATRQAIVGAARQLFSERGYFATKVDDVAALARVAPATVYAVSGGKQGLLLSTPLKKCIGTPEQKYISDAGKKAPELGAFSSGIRLGWDYPPAGPSWPGVSGAC